MKPTVRFFICVLVVTLMASACGAPVSTATQTPGVSPTGMTAPAASLTPAEATATPEASATPTVTLLDLEIVEWYEHPIPNLVDPSIADTNIEILVRNPNGFPVHVNTDELEFRLRDEAGEVVYTTRASYFSLWQGTWMLPGDSTGFQICACFESSGGEKREWDSIELTAPIEPAADVIFTMDVEATLGEPISLAEAHLGGSGTGIPITLTNTSDQALGNMPMRVIARDAGGRYIGMAAFGNSVVSFTEDISIQPGQSLDGILDSEIDYYAEPLTYEVVAIGIPASSASGDAVPPPLPSGTPRAEWEGIPIMPGAIAGEAVADDAYQFTITAGAEEVTGFYETELANLGYQLETTDEQERYTTLYFSNGSATVLIVMAPLGGLTGVVITRSR